jgi:hypothetical protein
MFAFIGLIAGIDVSTAICFAIGLFGGLAYPMIGLVSIANITLVVLGSGLLNKKQNTT